jgi:hypothetical protein
VTFSTPTPGFASHATNGNHSTGCSGLGVPANGRFGPLRK